MTSAVPLKLAEISKSFGSLQALKPLTLAIGGGEMLALLGPSGCGKTTTLRIIAGFEAPDTGQVLIGGQDVTDLAPNRRGLGMVFQNYSLFPHMSVAENVAYGLRCAACRRRSAGCGCAGCSTSCGSASTRTGRSTSSPAASSSGWRSPARWSPNPSVLLLDEPLGALDKNLRERMQFELREIQRRLGITSIIVTHDQEEALTMSDRVAVMAEGRIVQVGAPTEVYERPHTRFVSEFLGTANIFAGTVADRAGPEDWAVTLDLDRPRAASCARPSRSPPGAGCCSRSGPSA